jgi:hypothetical protein
VYKVAVPTDSVPVKPLIRAAITLIKLSGFAKLLVLHLPAALQTASIL